MAHAIKDFLKNHFPLSSFGERNKERHGSREYLHVENQGESDEDEIVYPSEEMTKASEKESSKNTSALQAAWNVLNLIQGTGTLGVPFAVMQGGYMSLVAIALISIITNYTGKLIIECLYEKPLLLPCMFSVVALVMVFTSVIGYGVTQRYEWDFNLGVTTLEGFPVAWGIILFSFVCHPYLPGIEETMEKPEEFNSIMNYSFFASAVTKLIYGFIAVLTFRGQTQQEISENLPPGALQNTANALLGLNGMFSYALPLLTLITIIHKAQLSYIPPCFPDEKHPLTIKERAMIYSLRAVFVVFTVMVAVLLPQFSLLMAVIGSISGVLLTLVFPCLFDVMLHIEHISTSRYVINLLIVCVGVLSGGFGLVFSLIAITKLYV
ncbi:Vesicular inhibitory amino acid transporter [Stylophora pistillata]|uniref:Vesicular inhibitory amino acid transporter n=1 Tax=Stylophora pistillata TaxID=50429 RepID=A0A2B4RL25_STYPI|nr:Vesicular inhibitory amino acid transporter [Stylophora pistillata]